tara:strand:- start:2 stop:505 length:504 start_codon:yes stop_codon:yes gene_type:complete
MKFFYIFLTICLVTLNNSNSYSKDKIAFIDLNYILTESDEGKNILKKLEIDNNKNLKFFEAEEEKLKKEKNDIDKLKNILSLEDYNKKKILFKNKVNAYNQNKSDMIKSFEKIKNKELNSFFSNLNEIMNIFMKDHSINLILDKKNIVMANNDNDISDDILKLVNKK